MKEALDNFYYRCRNLCFEIYYGIPTFKTRRENRILSQNKKYKDLYKGQRVFILGNGPSIKEENISSLCQEHVFTVNQGVRNPAFILSAIFGLTRFTLTIRYRKNKSRCLKIYLLRHASIMTK